MLLASPCEEGRRATHVCAPNSGCSLKDAFCFLPGSVSLTDVRETIRVPVMFIDLFAFDVSWTVVRGIQSTHQHIKEVYGGAVIATVGFCFLAFLFVFVSPEHMFRVLACACVRFGSDPKRVLIVCNSGMLSDAEHDRRLRSICNGKGETKKRKRGVCFVCRQSFAERHLARYRF